MVKKKLAWLLLLVRLPATHKAERVAIWRKMKKSGAIQIQTSTYVLPDDSARYEAFQWLTQEIRHAGGAATLVRAREIEGLSNKKLIDLFNAARAREYDALADSLRRLEHRSNKSSSRRIEEKIGRLRKQFRNIRQADFFGCPHAAQIEKTFRRIEKDGPKSDSADALSVRDYRGKRWLTRPRPEIDRVGSAWLIRRLIDPKAKFEFAPRVPTHRRLISFDMLDADFSHRGDDCTFEILLQRFGLDDPALRKIGEMIHDADLEDNKFDRPEGIGIHRMLKGWARQGMSDHEILRRGFECFDGLCAFFRSR